MEPQVGTWQGTIKSWEIARVNFKDNRTALKLVIWLNVTGDGWTKTMKWEDFFLKTNGEQNKKTYNTLKVCGFKYDNVESLLEDDALDKGKTYTVTVESETSGDKTYWKVAWINTDHESKGAIKDKAKLKGHNLGKLNSFLETKAAPRNYAPQSSTTDDIDSYLNS